MEADFSGYATKAGLKCSDGRTITAKAFEHMDKQTVPLVWQHGHSSADNVLGHAVLEARPDGVYAYGFFNDTPQGENAKKLVEHKDINSLSIYANQLVEKSKLVIHGFIREVSLVLSGANPEAKIDFVRLQHSSDVNDYTELEDEAVIEMGLPLVHSSDETEDEEGTEEEENDEVSHSDADKVEEENDEELAHAAEDRTVQDVLDSMTEEQRNVTYYMVGAMLEEKMNASSNSAGHSEDDKGENIAHKEEGNDDMSRNVFDQNGAGKGATATATPSHTLSHEDVKGIVSDAMRMGSLKEAVEQYALKHGIENIEVLFPDAKNLTDRPEFNQRRMEWVAGVLNSTRHTPFARVKSLTADITQDEARARGYIKGHYKKPEWFGVTKRTTTPTTIYKKQQLDRDDIVDITDFDVVAWLKMEMRMMLEEELARAILMGDGRDVSDEDKIKDPVGASDGAGIRSIANDHELYVTTVNVNIDDDASNYGEIVESILRARKYYKGTGMPTLYTTEETLVEMLLVKDGFGRPRWNSETELAAAMRVREIVAVEPMEHAGDLLGIIVNLADYNIGTDKGGEVNLFDDFDIDYNTYKYLMETRLSGALVKIKSALVIRRTAATNVLVTPVMPTFDSTTGVVTIPTVTGVVYKDGSGSTLSAGAQTALTAGTSMTVNAFPTSGYYFATNADDSWSFKRPAA